jgi:hypothetical protein
VADARNFYVAIETRGSGEPAFDVTLGHDSISLAAGHSRNAGPARASSLKD